MAFSLAALTRLPCQEFLEQAVALLGGKRCRFLAATGEELVELLALALRHRLTLAQPFLGGLEPLPAWHHRRKIVFLPFRIARRLREFGKPREENVVELLDAPISIRA